MSKHIHDTSKTVGFLESIFENSKKLSRYKASFFLFHAPFDPLVVFKKLKPFQLIQQAEISHCRFKSSPAHRSDEAWPSGDFFLMPISGVNDVWALVSSEERRFNDRIQKFFSYWKSPFTRSFYSTHDISQILTDIHSRISGSYLEAIKTVAYSRDQLKATIKFDNLDFKEALDQIEDQDAFLSKIQFKILHKSIEILKAGIQRDCLLAYCSGDIHTFYNSCLIKAAKILKQNVELLSNKSRKNYADEVKPMEIRYEIDVFKNKSDNILLRHALAGMKRVSFTVFHSNPYFHGALLDFKDGSRFDIYITSSKTISVIPGFQASPAAFSRLISHIFESVKEGSIHKEPAPSDYSLEDLIAGKI